MDMTSFGELGSGPVRNHCLALVMASEAKPSRPSSHVLDRRVASLLAMTVVGLLCAVAYGLWMTNYVLAMALYGTMRRRSRHRAGPRLEGTRRIKGVAGKKHKIWTGRAARPVPPDEAEKRAIIAACESFIRDVLKPRFLP